MLPLVIVVMFVVATIVPPSPQEFFYSFLRICQGGALVGNEIYGFFGKDVIKTSWETMGQQFDSPEIQKEG